MLVSDLPEGVIANIASYLDSNSLLALHTASQRLQDVTRRSLECSKMEKISELGVACLEVNASAVRRLDVSNWTLSLFDLDSVISKCLRVKELNILESIVSHYALRALQSLEELETLYISSQNPKFWVDGIFPSLKKLYIDTDGDHLQLRYVMKLINSCSALEVLHVDLKLQGSAGFSRAEPPAMDAERWKSLKTVLCSCPPSKRRTARSLLKVLFAHNPIPGLDAWIAREQNCYIYESGHVSGRALTDETSGDRVKLLKRFHFVDLRADGAGDNILKTPWGWPRSVCFTGFNDLFTGGTVFASSTITEMDLTACHGIFRERSRSSLIASSPSLRVLACSLCFLRPDRSGGMDDNPFGNVRVHDFRRALESVKLEKLFIGRHCGIVCIGYCCDTCDHCRGNLLARTLTSEDLIDLSGLNYLKELSLRRVKLDESAFIRLGNSALRTVKLDIEMTNDFSGLEYFIQHCGNMEELSLKISNPLRDRTMAFWEALHGATKLKRLCTQLNQDDQDFLVYTRSTFVTLLRQLECLHLHRVHRELLAESTFGAEDERLKERIIFAGECCAVSYEDSSDKCRLGHELCSINHYVKDVPLLGEISEE